ncbi:MAG: hypothetical protein BA871_07425 [Desulfuromonadales bacterium C00003096]|nr:MAG: hypothetical protein BA871_07425 [Desulfuromonadales bacterium C00003096]
MCESFPERLLKISFFKFILHASKYNYSASVKKSPLFKLERNIFSLCSAGSQGVLSPMLFLLTALPFEEYIASPDAKATKQTV